jgi:hypothetical protein
MFRKITVVMLLLVVVAGSTRAAEAWSGEGAGEAVQQFDHWGFSIAPEPQRIGDELKLVCVLNPATTWVPLPLDFSANEYTVHVYGLVLKERIQDGPFVQSIYSQGFADIYADPSFNAPFTYNTSAPDVPPLDPDQVPANFMDGELIVRFTVSDVVTIFYTIPGIGTVAYTNSDLRVIGGSARDLLNEEHMIVGWHMGGGYTDEPGTVPQGYGYRYDTLFRWENPLPVEPATWGGIKSSFK